jgi:hypothetical protein
VGVDEKAQGWACMRRVGFFAGVANYSILGDNLLTSIVWTDVTRVFSEV